MKNAKNNNNLQGILSSTIIMLIGIGIIFYTWKGMKINLENLYSYMLKNGFAISFSLLFIIIGLYSWKVCLINSIMKPKKETLYLKQIKDIGYLFVDKKGKKYIYIANDIDNIEDTKKLNKGTYYTVVKTKDTIRNILDISNDSFPICKEKVSFWSNWYTPVYNFEDILLLPILYCIFIPMFLFFIVTKGAAKTNSFILLLLSGASVIYDIIYKIKKNKVLKQTEKISNINQKNDELEKINMKPELAHMREKSLIVLFLLIPILKIIISLFLLVYFIWFLIKMQDTISSIFFSTLIIFSLGILRKSIINFIKILNELKNTTSRTN